LTNEFASVIAERQLGHAAIRFKVPQRSHHILSIQALANFEDDTLSRKDISDRQRSETSSVLQLIRKGNRESKPDPVQWR
jgi:hypothetical protein